MSADGVGSVEHRVTKVRGEISGRMRLVLCLAAAAFYAVFVLRTSVSIGGVRYFVLFEDAMISMRYARHLAEGHGLAWNVGESPVEGFTNLLWVLWMTVPHLAGMSESKCALFVMLSGVVLLLATGTVAARIARKVSHSVWVPTAVLAATLFCYPLAFWTLRGMEVGALALLVAGTVLLTFENEERFSMPRSFAIGSLAALALLLRSDAVVPLGAIVLYGVATTSRRWRFLLVVGAFVASVVVGQTALRLAYFHEALPNTYYLKLYGITLPTRLKRGAFVTLTVLAHEFAVPMAALFSALSMRGIVSVFTGSLRARRLALLSALVLGQIGYSIYVGGDAWEWMQYANRYVSASAPLLIVLVTATVERMRVRGLSVALSALGLLLVLFNALAWRYAEIGIAATIAPSRTSLVTGCLLIALGAVSCRRKLARVMAAWAKALSAGLRRQRSMMVASVIVAAMLWLPGQLLSLGRWGAHGAAQFDDEARYTRLGLILRHSTERDFRIAVAAAGATPYFSERPTEDLLGKNDKHVARLAPRGVFSPGHDKWDYDYSLRERKAQLIVETVDVSDADEALIGRLGFRNLPNGMRLRDDAQVLSRELLMAEDVELAASQTRVPPGYGVIDLACVLAFGLVAALVIRSTVREAKCVAGNVFDEVVKRALAGADAPVIPTLDGLRGIAVLLVLAFHFAWTLPTGELSATPKLVEWVSEHLRAFVWSGWIGVDLFFVLSGYLITRGLVSGTDRPMLERWTTFMQRRVLRIFPLYYAMMLVGTAVSLLCVVEPPGWSYWLYAQNYTLAFDSHVLRWTAHLWSLAIEEQFYLVWPLVAFTVPRRRLLSVIVGLIVLTAAVRAGLAMKGEHVQAIARWFSHEPEGASRGIAKLVYRATFTRADGLLLGAFVAVTQREVRHPLSVLWRRWRTTILVGSAAVLLGLYVVGHGLNDYDRRVMVFGYGALGLFFACIVSLCADFALGSRTTSLLSSAPLVACGKVSYGMYLFHWPIVVLVVPSLSRWQAGKSLLVQLLAVGTFTALGITAVGILSWVSYRYFEAPFLRLKARVGYGLAREIVSPGSLTTESQRVSGASLNEPSPSFFRNEQRPPTASMRPHSE